MSSARQVIAFEWFGRHNRDLDGFVMHLQSRVVWTRSGPAGDNQPEWLAPAIQHRRTDTIHAAPAVVSRSFTWRPATRQQPSQR
jgi:hypothetical protein